MYQGTQADKTRDASGAVVAGSTNLTLACTDTTATNSNWTIGQIYSQRDVRCAPVTVTIPAA